MRAVGEQLGNTPAVARTSYVSPGGGRAVSRRENDRGFPAAAFAGRHRARYRPRPGRTGPVEPASLVANSTGASRSLISYGFAKLTPRSSAEFEEESVARVTRLVCDNCGKEVDEGKGAVMRVTSPMRAAARSRPISATTARARCRASRSRGAAAGRRPQPAASQRTGTALQPPQRAQETSDPGLGWIGGSEPDHRAANAGRWRSCCERYLEASSTRAVSDRAEPVGRRARRARPARAAAGAARRARSGRSTTSSSASRAAAATRGRSRPTRSARCSSAARRAAVAERPRPLRALRRLRRRAARRRSRSSSRACSTRTTSTAISPALYAAYRGELDRLGLWDRDLLRRHAAERVRRTSSTPGAASRSSRTASRI